jgi:hypothetical protein
MNRSTPRLAALALALTLSACSKDKVCAPDETKIGDTCYALRSDPSNCGSRGNVCGANQGCFSGACVDCAAPGGACSAAIVAACYNLNQARPLTESLDPANVPLATDDGPIAFARLGTQLFVANSRSSTVSTVPAASGGASIVVPSPFSDLEHVGAHGGLLWVSNAATGTLVAIDPVHGNIVEEIPVAQHPTDFASPAGLDFVGAKGYLALNGANQVAVLDLSTVPGGKVTKWIDLSAQATGAASAAPSRVLAVGTRVYVTMNDLFDPSFAPVTGAHGKLAVIDTATDTLAGNAVDLGPDCWNASGIALSGTTLWVACGYIEFDASFHVVGVRGTSLVPVELASGAPVVGTTIPVPNALTSIAICGGRGYAGASDSGTVFSFDPAAHTIIGTALACPPAAGKGSYVPAVACAH